MSDDAKFLTVEQQRRLVAAFQIQDELRQLNMFPEAPLPDVDSPPVTSWEHRDGELFAIDGVPLSAPMLEHYKDILLAKYLHKHLRFSCRQIAQVLKLDAGTVSRRACSPLPTREQMPVDIEAKQLKDVDFCLTERKRRK